MARQWRATRNEPRVGIGEWTGDFHRDETYVESHQGEDGIYPRGKNLVPDYICSYLASHGLLIDASVSLTAADSPAPPVGPQPIVTPLTEEFLDANS